MKVKRSFYHPYQNQDEIFYHIEIHSGKYVLLKEFEKVTEELGEFDTLQEAKKELDKLRANE